MRSPRGQRKNRGSGPLMNTNSRCSSGRNVTISLGISTEIWKRKKQMALVTSYKRTRNTLTHTCPSGCVRSTSQRVRVLHVSQWVRAGARPRGCACTMTCVSQWVPPNPPPPLHGTDGAPDELNLTSWIRPPSLLRTYGLCNRNRPRWGGGSVLEGLLASTGSLPYLLNSASEPESQHEQVIILRKTPNPDNLLKSYGLCNRNRARFGGSVLEASWQLL